MVSPLRPFLGVSLLRGNRCLSCQYRKLQPHQFSRQKSDSEQPPQNQSSTKSESTTESDDSNDEKEPSTLKHLLGLPDPPQEGENTGVDQRTLRQRGDDLVDQEKHIKRRAHLAKEFTKPYFRDMLRTRHHHGKTFIANPRLFREDKALYFPNLYGRTLSKTNPLQNTTSALRGKISVVSIFTTLWAEQQTASFVGEKQNPALHSLIQGSDSMAQRVEINAEPNRLKAWLVRMFMWSLRRKYAKEQRGRYFLVRKGFSQDLKEQIGMMNNLVGHVYLLDENCKIRWAGNSIAQADELTSLNNGLRKLTEQKRLGATMPQSRSEKPEPDQEKKEK